jgi:hypothetical protein
LPYYNKKTSGKLYWYEPTGWLNQYLDNAYVGVMVCPEDPLAESATNHSWHSYIRNVHQSFLGADGSFWGRRLNKTGYIYLTDYNWDIPTGPAGPGTFSETSSYIIRVGTPHGNISSNVLFDDSHVEGMTYEEVLCCDRIEID